MSEQQIQDAERRVAETQHEREGQLARMRQVRAEYDALGETLKVLPERIERPVMVPFGKLALFQGSLRHTNEVTVLLGENIFAKRSASQAAGITDRRAEFVQTQIDNLTSELSHLQSEREKLSAMRTLGLGAGRGGSTSDPWGLDGGGDADGAASGLVTNPDGTVEIREEYEDGEWDHGRDGAGGGAGGSESGDVAGGGGLARVWSTAAVQDEPAKKPEAFKQQVLERVVDTSPPVMPSGPPAPAPGPELPTSAEARGGGGADSAAAEEPPTSQDGGKRVSRFMASRQ